MSIAQDKRAARLLRKVSREILNAIEKDEDEEMVEMYESDAADYAAIAKLADEHNLVAAVKTFEDMDTAARDEMYHRLTDKQSKWLEGWILF